MVLLILDYVINNFAFFQDRTIARDRASLSCNAGVFFQIFLSSLERLHVCCSGLMLYLGNPSIGKPLEFFITSYKVQYITGLPIYIHIILFIYNISFIYPSKLLPRCSSLPFSFSWRYSLMLHIYTISDKLFQLYFNVNLIYCIF